MTDKKETTCRLGRRPVKQGPRTGASGPQCVKYATTNSKGCSKCGKIYIRRIPLQKHQKKCKGIITNNSSFDCKNCGKKYTYKSCLEKHMKKCVTPVPNTVPSSVSTPIEHSKTEPSTHGRFKINKSSYPDRLKVIIWKATRGQHSTKELTRMVRNNFDLDKSMHVFVRGKERNRRVEIWCQDRKSAISTCERLQYLCKVNHLGYFCTLGRNYCEREKRRQHQMATDDPLPNVTLTDSQSDSSIHEIQDAPQVFDLQQFKILQWNAQSIGNKVDEFRLLLHDLKVDIACLSETRITDSEKWKDKFKGYSLYNFERPDKEGGGVCILVRTNFGITNISTYYSQLVEYISADITIAHDHCLSITSVYARNGCSHITTELDPCVKQKNCLILGDFNAKHSVWGSTKTNPSGSRLLDWINDKDLIILNSNQHTFQSHSSGVTDAIDISIASPDLASKMSQWTVIDDSLGSDHSPVITTMELQGKSREGSQNPKWNLQKADRELFKAYVDVSSLEAQQQVDDKDLHLESKVDVLTTCVIEAAEKSYPVSKRHKRPPVPWWNDDIASLKREKRKAQRKWKNSNTEANKIMYKKQQAKLKRAIKSAKRSSWRDFVGSINRDTPSSEIWRKIKAISGGNQSGPSAIQHDGKMVIDQGEQANLFAEYYSSKCSMLADASEPN